MGIGILLDLGLLGLVIFCAWRAAHKGFVRELLELAGWAACLYGALRLSPMLAERFCNSFLLPFLRPKLAGAVEASLAATAGETAHSLWAQLPGFFTRAAAGHGVGQPALERAVAGGFDAGSGAIADGVLAEVVAPVARFLTRWVFAILLFLLGMLLVRILIRLPGAVLHLPGVHAVNRLLGGLFGLGKGALLAVLCCLLCGLAASFCDPAGFFAGDLLPTSRLYLLLTEWLL